MECMALMIMARSLEKMDALFEHIIILFLQKDSEKSNEHLKNFLQIKKKKNTSVFEELTNNYESDESESLEEMSWEEFKCIYKINPSIYAKSPFYIRYFRISEKIKEKIKIENHTQKECVLYCPQFVDCLLTTYMAYCPIWSGMMLDLVDPNISRVSNVYAESIIKTYKHNLLNGKRQWRIGKVCRVLEENNEKLVKENVISKIKMKSNLKDKNYDLYRKFTSDSLDTQIWERIPEVQCNGKNSKKVRKRKIRHMSGKKIIRLRKNIKRGEDRLDELWESDLENKDEKKPKRKRRRKQKNPKIETKNQKKSVHNLNYSGLDIRNKEKTEKKRIKEEQHLEVQKTKRDTNPIKTIPKLKNGLVNDIGYFVNSRSKKIVIAHYYPATEKFIINKELKLSAHQFRQLLSRCSSMDAEVIDLVAAARIDKWSNVTYLSTDVAYAIMNSTKIKESSQDRQYHNIKNLIEDRIFIPYYYQQHWMLLIINIPAKTFEVLDPYDRPNNFQKLLDTLTMYVDKCNHDSTIKRLIPKNLKVVNEIDRPFQKPIDTWNSAAYIMYYMEYIEENKKMDKNFNPEEYRETLLNILITQSLEVNRNCLYCFEDSNTDTNMTCIMCKRLLHSKCFQLDEMETENEEQLEFDEPSKKRKRKLNSDKNDQCRRCRRYKLRYLRTYPTD